MATARQSDRAVLNSWKEIAGYLGRGVRTVQRWEHNLGLPVRRPHGKSRSAVIALTTELDEWLRIAPKGPPDHPSPIVTKPFLVTAVRKSVRDMAELRQVCQDLRSANAEAMHTLVDTIQHMQELLHFTQRAARDWRTGTNTGAASVGKMPPTKPN